MQVTDKITITNEDNMLLMSRFPDNYFELAIVDPPYGIDVNKMNLGDSGKNKKSHKKDGKIWDSETPPQEYFNELFRVSKNQIIFGANYMIDKIKKPSMGWFYWDKQNGESDFSDGELAYTSFNRALRSYKYHLSKDRDLRFHPTQKPQHLYKKLLDLYAKEGDKILDTHLGSGSIAIACHDYGFELTACELDKEYYDKAIQRIVNHTNQTKLF
jgi:site-specific DNA-methyltransferase (adenine-specific)